MELTTLTSQFLIAMPSLGDPNFSHTVILLCQHNPEGTLGIIINRPSAMKLSEIFRQMNITGNDQTAINTPVFTGGPVQPERGFVIHNSNSQWDSTLPIAEDVKLTTSRDILEAIAVGEGPEKSLIALGYAGWGENQLAQEIINNAWLNSPFNQTILFDTPIEQRWHDAANQIGIDISKLTTPAGHG